MRNLSELNINTGGAPVRRAPPTEADITAFEKRFGLKLPVPYVAMLRYANGGHPQLDSLEPVGTQGGNRWAVNNFFHLSNDRDGVGSLWHATETWQRILGKSALPIASDGGGNVFFIDTSSQSGAVKVCIHDANFAVRDVATSFEDFIDRLSIDPDYI